MIDRHPIVAFILTVVLAVYLLVALRVSADMSSAQPYTSCRITIDDTTATGFVSQTEVSQECGDIMQWIGQRPRGHISLDSIERTLRRCDKIERVNVCELNNGVLAIDVVPMTPVARVFDINSSYYINAEGKRISATPRYHVDVPVVVGSFPASRPARRLLPLLSYIAAHPELDALVSTVKQDSRGDIIIVPTIRGHVVNFGDTSMVADKFDRLRRFYRGVMPTAGWETYDTLAVKWRGRVVATRRNKALGASMLSAVVEEFDDIDDHDTMRTPLHGGDSTQINP